jgi:GNAT superfamily N-acetyltransferase
MLSPSLNWTRANTADADSILSLMRAFYAEEGLTFREDRARRALLDLLTSPELGAAFLLQDDKLHLGYFLVTLGFSAEFDGRFALLDELYLLPEARGLGAGRGAIACAEIWGRQQQVSTIRLELNPHNDKARTIYTKAGFEDHDRRILTKWLEP